MKLKILFTWTLLALMAMVVSACSSRANSPEVPTQTLGATLQSAQETFNDPFAYCATVGTIDTPDARYSGPQISDEIISDNSAA